MIARSTGQRGVRGGTRDCLRGVLRAGSLAAGTGSGLLFHRASWRRGVPAATGGGGGPERDLPKGQARRAGRRCAAQRLRRSFTLTELMIVIVIITIMAAIVMFALFDVMESAKEARTRAQIAKLHQLIMTRWESYHTRAVRLNIPLATTSNATVLSAARLLALRDLMRMELPERITDLTDGPITIDVPQDAGGFYQVQLSQPALWRSYRRRAGYTPPNNPPSTWTVAHQGAECLYLIISAMRDGESSGLDFFKDTEIGDTDQDGMLEILDAWGRPIDFLRWAPGFSVGVGIDGQWGEGGINDDGANGTDDIEERGWPGSDDELVSELQKPDPQKSPDPFDPLKVDAIVRANAVAFGYAGALPPRKTFALVPLIFSAGRDRVYDITTEASSAPIRYANPVGPNLRNDPFYVIPSPSAGVPEKQLGLPWDISGDVQGGPDGELGSVDNLTNHLLEVY